MGVYVPMCLPVDTHLEKDVESNTQYVYSETIYGRQTNQERKVHVYFHNVCLSYMV